MLDTWRDAGWVLGSFLIWGLLSNLAVALRLPPASMPSTPVGSLLGVFTFLLVAHPELARNWSPLWRLVTTLSRPQSPLRKSAGFAGTPQLSPSGHSLATERALARMEAELVKLNEVVQGCPNLIRNPSLTEEERWRTTTNASTIATSATSTKARPAATPSCSSANS